MSGGKIMFDGKVIGEFRDVTLGIDLDKVVELFGFTRAVIDDGREPDRLTGLPMETDDELRQRVRKWLLEIPRKSPT